MALMLLRIVLFLRKLLKWLFILSYTQDEVEALIDIVEVMHRVSDTSIDGLQENKLTNFKYILYLQRKLYIIIYFVKSSNMQSKIIWKEQHPGFIPILSSLDNCPIENILDKWQSKVCNGHIKRITDQDIDLPVFQIMGTNIQKNLIALPSNQNTSLKIKLPILVMLVKNVTTAAIQLDKYFKFEVTVIDDKGTKRKFISANNQSITRIKPFQCAMPLELQEGWNQIVFDLDSYCEKAFGTKFVECVRVQVNANCRLTRIYFNDFLKTEEEIPPNYKLFMRVQTYKS